MVLTLTAGFALASNPGPQTAASQPLSHWTADNDQMRGLTMLDPELAKPIQSSAANNAKADSVLVYFADFEVGGGPSFDGWVGHDYTLLEPKWQISTFNAETLNGHGAGNHAFWAGEDFGYNCGVSNEGYGNWYDEHLDWEMAIPNSALGCTVNVRAYVNVDTETNYDYLYLMIRDDDGVMQEMELFAENPDSEGALDSTFVNYYVDAKYYLAAEEYGLTNTVKLRWKAFSDWGTSDATCKTDSVSGGSIFDGNGHSQIDDVEVWFDQGGGYVQQGVTNTFEPGSTVEWEVTETPYVGDFSNVWDRLNDLDECDENFTPQMAFVDYGQHPGIGPSTSSWEYGPQGYVTNYTFGFSDAIPANKYRLWNGVHSPVFEIDPTKAGHAIRYGAWLHFEIHSTAGMFMQLMVRSSLDGVIWTQWGSTGTWYGGPYYLRTEDDVTNALVPGAQYAQISAAVYQPTWHNPNPYGESTPAPYYDDISWHSWDITAPSLGYGDLDLPHDSTPHDTDGVPIAMNWSDLGNMDVPFDQGSDKIILTGPNILHGDSILIYAQSVSAGGGLTEPPWFHYTVRTNPVFDASLRTSGVAYTDSVQADTIWVADQYYNTVWSVDLPDRDFLYPGDVMHYYFTVADTVNGGDPRRVALPGTRLDHFGVFEGDEGYTPLAWPEQFQIHALPTVKSTDVGDVPDILFWNDFGFRGGLNESLGALYALGLERGVDFDMFTTRQPDSARGNGIGAFFNVSTLNYYDHIIYDAGNLLGATMAGTKTYDVINDEYNGDGSNDIAMIKSYLLGPRNLYAVGHQFIGGIEAENDGTGVQLVGTYFGVDWIDNDVKDNIGGQTAPVIQGVTNGTGLYIPPEHQFLAFGSCPVIREFDAIAPQAGTAESVAEFLDADGNSGVYTGVSAMVANNFLSGAKVVVCPVGFYHQYEVPGKSLDGVSARAKVLCDVLSYFYNDPSYCDNLGPGVDVPPTSHPFYAKNWPNPFNPITKIEFSLPREGHVSLKVYNVRGELVRTLVDENRPAGPQVVEWDGSNDRGHSVASGVYFYETRTAGKSTIQKMALVK